MRRPGGFDKAGRGRQDRFRSPKKKKVCKVIRPLSLNILETHCGTPFCRSTSPSSDVAFRSNLQRPTLHRALEISFRNQMISCVFGPPGAGKTILLREFQSNNSVCQYVKVDLARRDENAFDILKNATGLDL